MIIIIINIVERTYWSIHHIKVFTVHQAETCRSADVLPHWSGDVNSRCSHTYRCFGRPHLASIFVVSVEIVGCFFFSFFLFLGAGAAWYRCKCCEAVPVCYRLKKVKPKSALKRVQGSDVVGGGSCLAIDMAQKTKFSELVVRYSSVWICAGCSASNS